MSNKLDLSIIIVNFNTKQITLNCLDSIYRHTQGINFEIILVDNGSSDGSIEALSKLEIKYKNLKLIRSAENLGFGAGNNIGANTARGEYILFLNTDTLLSDNVLPRCLEAIRSDDQIGAYSCNLTNQDGTHQPSGGYFPTLVRLIAWQLFLDDLPLISYLFKSIHPHISETKPDWVTGAFMIIPARNFREVGGFDENIFMYTEELELCYRIKKLGKKVVLDNKSSIIHLGGASGGSYLAITKEVEGLLYFWKKHYSSSNIYLVKSIFFIGSLLRLVIFGIIKANATYRKSYWDVLRLLS